MLRLANYFFQGMNPVLILIILILFNSGCNGPEIDIPEHVSHDWFAYYVVDGNEQTIIKDGNDNAVEPWLISSQSYGFNVLPDGSEEVIFVSMESGVSAISEETGSQIGFTFDIVTQDLDLIAMKGLSKEMRINKLMNYLDGRKFFNIPGNRIDGEYINIRLQDKKGNLYLNNLFNNGSYAVILDYEITVIEVNVITHEEHGDVVQVSMDFKAEAQDTERKIDYRVEASTKTYLIVPFE